MPYNNYNNPHNNHFSNRRPPSKESLIPWPLVIVGLCVFTPVGVVLAALRLYQDYLRSNAQNRQPPPVWNQGQRGGQSRQGGQTGQTGWQGQNSYYHYSYQQGQQKAQQNSQGQKNRQEEYARQTQQARQGQQRWQTSRGNQKGQQGQGQQQSWQKTPQAAAGSSALQRSKIIQKLTSSKAGRHMITGGLITAGVGLFAAGMEIFDNFWMIQDGWFADLAREVYPLMFLVVVGILLCYYGRKKNRKARKFREYLSLVGKQSAVSIQDLAHVTNQSYHKVCDDLQELIEKGAFPEQAYVDLSAGLLVLDPAAMAQESAKQEQEKRAAQQAEADSQDPSKQLIQEIRRINDAIADPHLSEQIDRIEEITRLILQCQKEHPEKAPQLHSFLSYYLPTTLKILTSYAEMEKQSIQGKNIAETKERIERMMDKVVLGFETQLDQLFADDRIDITADISVLEQMMARDGLTSDFNTAFNTAPPKAPQPPTADEIFSSSAAFQYEKEAK